MSISVLGCGHWGKNLIRNFSELGALASISDPNEKLASKYSALYGVKAISFEEVLASDCLGVVIAAPAVLHETLAVKALEAGKHVFVEKPLAMTLAEADNMIAAAERADRHLMVGHLLQYHPVFEHLLKMVKSGAFGELIYMYSNRFSFGKVRCEEDVVWSFSPHDISMLLSLANEQVTSVGCHSLSNLQNGLSDSAIINLTFESGLKATASCSWLHPVKEQKLVIIGDLGMAVFDDTLDWENKLAVYRHVIDKSRIPPNLEKADAEFIQIEQHEPLKAECKYFLDLITGHAPNRTGGDEGREVLKVLTEASVQMKKMEGSANA